MTAPFGWMPGDLVTMAVGPWGTHSHAALDEVGGPSELSDAEVADPFLSPRRMVGCPGKMRLEFHACRFGSQTASLTGLLDS
jgi:hypothetical protein